MNQYEEKEPVFFGKITAGITHEIKNVLAIIQQSSGLIEDIMSISPEAPILHQDKIQASLSRIKDQIKRGTELTGRLNKFAHGTHKSIAKVDLYEITEQLVFLSMRFAKNKKVVLKIHPPDQTISIVTYQVQLQKALFKCIECCLDLMTQGGEINIYPQKDDEKLKVYFLCEGDSPLEASFANNISVSEKWPVLQEITTSLGGLVKTDESTSGILLILPSALKE